MIMAITLRLEEPYMAKIDYLKKYLGEKTITSVIKRCILSSYMIAQEAEKLKNDLDDTK